ncbi:MAG: hypothetical protein WB710_04810 [Stellaceae bacterium]
MSEPKDFPVWLTPQGEPVSCVEKIKVLNENLAELRELAQEALEDAVLMGGDERQLREVLAAIMAGLVNPYAK